VTRALALLLGTLLLAGAAPARRLPLPPPLPVDPPTDEPAPVPDADLRTPNALDPDQSAFALRVYRMQEHSTGEGFIPGSEYQSPEQRRPLQTPGFMVTLPLQ
jgi:hypothetical protein